MKGFDDEQLFRNVDDGDECSRLLGIGRRESLQRGVLQAMRQLPCDDRRSQVVGGNQLRRNDGRQ